MAVDPVSLAITAGLMAAQMALTMSQKIKGPRLDDLNVTLADYGSPIPRFWGRRRLQPQIIWAEKLKEKKKTRQTKGGKMTTYKYSGTWAVLICDHEIESVARIWMDKHLVYQTDSAGPVSLAQLVAEAGANKPTLGQNMRIYLGTEDQMPDPRMEAWCETRYGPDSCPAYRGSAYIVFQDVPLEKFGNRIPQITIEAISVKADAFPYESKAGMLSDDLLSSAITPDGTQLVVTNGSMNVQVWDLATRSIMYQNTIPDFVLGGYDFGMVDNETFYATTFLGGMWLCTTSGTATDLMSGNGGIPPGPAQYKGGAAYALPATTGFHYVHKYGSELVPFFVDFNCTCIFEDMDGLPWLVGPMRTGGNIGFRQDVTGDLFTINTGYDGDVGAIDNGNGQFFVWQQGGHVFIIDKETMTITAAESSSETGLADAELRRHFNYVRPGSTRIWLKFAEHDTITGEEVRSVNPTNWFPGLTSRTIYDPINHAIIGNGGVWRFLDRVGSPGVTLQKVVDDVAQWCGLTDHDASQLTQTVLGYSVTQGSGKDMIQPLLDIHDVDARPHDFSIQFVNRGGAPTGTLYTSDFVRDGDSPRYTVTIQQDTDLPRRLTFNYADDGKDQQTNTAVAQRPSQATDSNREETIDLTTYADVPASAQQKADRWFRREWNSRERVTLSLTAQEFALEPADRKIISLDGLLRGVRLEKMTIRGSVLDTEWVRDEVDLATLNDATGAEMEGRDPEVIFIPGPTKGFVLDIPLLADNDNSINPLLYVGAGSYAISWPGAIAYQEDLGSYADVIAAVDTESRAGWGRAKTALGDANPNLWDRGNSVNVTVFDTTLTSVAEAAVNADPSLNLVYLGGELLNFTTATLELDGTYTLTGLKRGRRGTEWAVDGHAIGEEFILASSLAPVQTGLDAVGDDLSFKVQTAGRDPEAATAIDLTFTGASLKPRAPVIWHVSKDATSGDITIELRSRTRVGGNWNGSAISTGETVESYAFDVYDGATFKRTLTSSTKTLTYLAADQATDGLSIEAEELEGFAYQLSATVGRGFARAA